MIGPGFAAAIGARMIKTIAVVLLVVAVLAMTVGYGVAVWRQCLMDNPWWYCAHILSR